MSALLIIFAFVLTVTSTVVQFEKQEEYEGFLDMIDRENQKHDIIFDKSIYGTDRHGRIYVKCVEFNSTVSSRSRNIRCPMQRGSDAMPACLAIYDVVNDEIVQGCYSYQRELASQCTASPMCLMNIHKRKIGFCCCVGDRCNRKENVYYNGKTLENYLNDQENQLTF
ncbi:unnamed protein product [Caenorhabditis angaria]|uniref:Activin_recp domain-containing protein n=1 Tax=Caenorhabditis angaria TaxID=860376 RepID=A0A9P1IXK8_9PELO|nr:unnamed protein product [Caenorhabditis angaria]